MTLRSFLEACISNKTMIIHLYDEKQILLITFELPGFSCLDDELEQREIKSWTINDLKSIKIILKNDDEQQP